MQRILTIFIRLLVLLLTVLIPSDAIPDDSEIKSKNQSNANSDQSKADNLVLLQEELALYRFRQAQKQLLELSKNYPQTAAGKRAREIIEREQLSPLANYGFVPENKFVNGIPACRNSFRSQITNAVCHP